MQPHSSPEELAKLESDLLELQRLAGAAEARCSELSKKTSTWLSGVGCLGAVAWMVIFDLAGIVDWRWWGIPVAIWAAANLGSFIFRLTPSQGRYRAELTAERERLSRLEQGKRELRGRLDRLRHAQREKKRARQLAEDIRNAKKPAYWTNLDWRELERVSAQLFKHLGFQAELTKEGSDGGVDIVCRGGGQQIAVQCKAWEKSVGRPDVQRLAGIVAVESFDRGILIAPNGWTAEAREFGTSAGVELWDDRRLSKLAENAGAFEDLTVGAAGDLPK
jgi:restriction system protein